MQIENVEVDELETDSSGAASSFGGDANERERDTLQSSGWNC